MHHLGDEGLYVAAQELNCVVNKRFFAGELLEGCIKVALREFGHAGHCFLLDCYMPGDHVVHALRHYPEGPEALFSGDSDIDVTLIVLGGHVSHRIDKAGELRAENFLKRSYLLRPVSSHADVGHFNPGVFQYAVKGVQHKRIADGLEVEIKHSPHGGFDAADFDFIPEVLPEIDAEKTLVFRIRTDVPLERQIDPVVDRTHVKPFLEVAKIPVDGSTGEDLCQITGLRGLQMLTERRCWHSPLAGDTFEELASRQKVELPVVKLSRDIRRHPL